MAHALYSRPSSPLSVQTQNEFLDNLTPIQNVQNAKDQSHDEIEKEVRASDTDFKLKEFKRRLKADGIIGKKLEHGNIIIMDYISNY